MNTIFSKLRDFVGLNEAEEYEYYDEEMDNTDYQNVYPEEAPAPTVEEQRPSRRRTRERSTLNTETDMASSAPRNNVIGMPGTAGLSEVVVVEPRTFEEMPQVIQALRERKSVVLNLTTIDPDEAQRAVDFVAGGTYAIDGHQERIGESIFLFTPSCVQVTTQSGTMNEVTQAPAAPMRQGSMPMQTPAAWGMEQDLMAQ